jgi:hypothetical protein
MQTLEFDLEGILERCDIRGCYAQPSEPSRAWWGDRRYHMTTQMARDEVARHAAVGDIISG